MTANTRIATLVDEVMQGRLSRREALRRAVALGVSVPTALALMARPAAARWPVSLPQARAAVPAPPIAKVEPSVRVFEGIEVEDPYAWLENPNDPAVIAYLEAENAYADAVMAPSAALQEALYNEMLGRIQETDVSVPIRIDDYFYYARTEEGLQYEVLCRRKGSMSAPEEVLLDLNELVEEYIALGGYVPSPDHRYLAYSLNEDGGIEYTLYVKDTLTGDLLPEVYPLVGNFDWATDGRTLFYTKSDDILRPFELYRHTVGADPATDALLYREEDEVYSIYVYTTRSRGYVVLGSYSYTTSEMRVLDAARPEGELILVEPRREGIEYYVDHHDDRFLIVTNDGAENFKVVAAPVATPGRANWSDFLPAQAGRLYGYVEPFAEHLAVFGREGGFSQVWICDPNGSELRRVEWDEAVYTVGGDANFTFDTTKLRLFYTSLVTPPMILELDMATGEKTVLKQQEVVGGHDPAAYTSERLAATAEDGTDVPISLVYRKDTKTSGPAPLLLYGYGAYGITSDPYFDSNVLSLLDRGVVYALAHVRGGQELGRPWYGDGKLLNKRNTFTDFTACAEHLIASGRTTSPRLVAWGGSAGGMLMGAVSNMRPDLFGGIVAEVPFVDLMRTMLDPSLPLTTYEYVEWGNPAEPEFYDYMKSYSPYDNVTAQAYPHMLLTGGLNDDQVPYWNPAKWAAKLRATKTDDNLLLLRTNMGAGHGGESGRYDELREIAFTQAFMLRTFGLADAPLPTATGGRLAAASLRHAFVGQPKPAAVRGRVPSPHRRARLESRRLV
jgi:oligopeptidase B